MLIGKEKKKWSKLILRKTGCSWWKLIEGGVSRRGGDQSKKCNFFEKIGNLLKGNDNKKQKVGPKKKESYNYRLGHLGFKNLGIK